MVARRLAAVSGTGTGIGKTHFCEAILCAMTAAGRVVVGLKPVETGLDEVDLSDADRLARASSFHVKQAGYAFGVPLSPHLAAREAGEPIRADVIVSMVEKVRPNADVTVVELAGGLFTPLSDTLVNADVLSSLKPDTSLLVAPDRLGVLHDVLSTSRAARTVLAVIHGIVLVTPAVPDASTGRNLSELQQ
ncbi:MAG TPA: dethiobiotin synthase, partial [Polyangiaceae bacterium]|nr:dethiobiotin synthase [Polyangiaceae bacterium]